MAAPPSSAPRWLRPAVLLVLSCVLWWYAWGRAEVPLLDLVDLGFHELSHMVTVVLGERAHFLAGSVGQILVPAGLAVYFWWRSDLAAAGLMGGWVGTSAADVSVYIADAPFQRLPLLGGGEHDWATLLGPRHFDAIHAADELATIVWVAGLVVAAAGVALVGWVLTGRLAPEAPQRARYAPRGAERPPRPPS